MAAPWSGADSDMSSVYSLSQALGQSWVGLTHENLGYPHTADLALAFIPDDLQLVFLRLIAHLVGDPIRAVHLHSLLGFALSAATFTAAAQCLRISVWVRLPLALSFALAPYHFVRISYGHVFLANYYMLPVAVLILVTLYSRVSSSQQFEWPRRTTLVGLLLGSVMVGSSGAYYGVFSGLLAAAVALLLPRGRQNLRDLLTRLGFTGLIVAAFLLAPGVRTVVARVRGLEDVLTRSPDESIRWGGQLSQLIIPWGTWLPRRLAELSAPIQFEWNPMPILGSLGFMVVMISLVRRIRVPHSNVLVSADIQFFVLISTFFFVSGGLGAVFAYTLDPSFRTWNRFHIYVLLFSLLGLGQALTRLASVKLVPLISTLLLVVVPLTQLRPLNSVGIGKEPAPSDLAHFDSIKLFGSELQVRLPAGCAILQLPTMMYPEGGQVGTVGNGQHLWLPLVTSGFRWSYGAPRGSSEGDHWLPFAAASVAETIEHARDLGMCAVLVDFDSGISPDQVSFLGEPVASSASLNSAVYLIPASV